MWLVESRFAVLSRHRMNGRAIEAGNGPSPGDTGRSLRGSAPRPSPVRWWLSLAVALFSVPPSFARANLSAESSAATSIDALRLKAEASDARAQVELGLRYIDGQGVLQDYGQAANWLRRAAMQGDAQGQLELGVMYVNGEGFPADLLEGYAWYLLSSQQGNRDAKDNLGDLEPSLAPADRDKARARAAEITRTIAAERAKHTPRHQHGEAAKNVESSKAAAAEAPSDAQDKKGTTSGIAAGKGPSKSFAEGKDYTVWQRTRIKDQNGFAQPVEAYSILLPKGWRTEGGVAWVVNVTCPADAVQNRLTSVSPDGAYRLEVFPQRNWQWYDDPMLLQSAMASAQSGAGGCPLARPFNAGEYLEQIFLPTDLRGASLVGHRPDEEMAGVMLQQAQRNNALFQASGVNLQTRPSAEIGRLRWPDGRIGIVLCAVEQTVGFMPNLVNGGTYASYQCRATVKMMLAAPAGQETEAERILGTIVASTRINPEWQAAVQRVYNNIASVERRETAKRAAIWRQTQNEISEIHQRTWENTQASRDRVFEEWGRALRGVDNWKDPAGESIELSAGYNEAWSKGDGTYILSNDPLFDPNVAFQENWNRLEKSP